MTYDLYEIWPFSNLTFDRLQSEYLEMVKQLEESKNMEAEERARLEAEINAKREEVSQLIQNKNRFMWEM